MLQGHQTWLFPSQPMITSTATAVGPMEGEGPLGKEFDIIHKDPWVGQDSWEKAEKRLLEDACEKAIIKSGIEQQDVQFFIGGDLLSQLISSNFAARTLAMPFLGMFAACATSTASLALAAQLVDGGYAHTIMCGTSSHNAAAEKQFRYPTEYGGQKPPTAQWTVTGAGIAIVQNKEKARQASIIKVTSATIGRVVDMGLTDPFNLGAAMAPAAVDTITAHFRDMGVSFADYDLVITGDLGHVGHNIATDLFKKQGFTIPDGVFQDCGKLIYGQNPTFFSGGSGAACSSVVTYSHVTNLLRSGSLNKVLFAATGALFSPLSYQQNESIPCICHAVVIEV